MIRICLFLSLNLNLNPAKKALNPDLNSDSHITEYNTRNNGLLGSCRGDKNKPDTIDPIRRVTIDSLVPESVSKLF